MDFKQLEKQYRDELLQNVIPFWLENRKINNTEATSPASTAKEMYSILINLFGYKPVRYGFSVCSTIALKNAKNG